jgi:hypothetical protein
MQISDKTQKMLTVEQIVQKYTRGVEVSELLCCLAIIASTVASAAALIAILLD